MAFFDWDGDGKITFSDDFLEFQIFEEVMRDEDESDTFDEDETSDQTLDVETGKIQHSTMIFPDRENLDDHDPPCDETVLSVSVLVCVLILGALVLATAIQNEEVSFFLLAAGVGISIFILKLSGTMK